MSEIGNYIFEVEDSSPLHVSGWIVCKVTSQPVELSILINDLPMFSIVANLKRPAAGQELSGFELSLESDFWRLAKTIRVCTSDGGELIALQKPGESVHKDSNGINHVFSTLNLMAVTGKFMGAVGEPHGIKLFSNGHLEAYETARIPPGDDDSPEKASEIGYSFTANPKRPLFSRFVVVTVDEKFAFVGNTHWAKELKTDDRKCVVPFPMGLDTITSMETRTDGHSEPVFLFSFRHFFGEGYGSLLVFDKDDRFETTLHQEKSDIVVRYGGGDFAISQDSVE